MVENISASLIDWSRAQFALTAMYHWIFVPLTLGLAVIMGIMETVYFPSCPGSIYAVLVRIDIGHTDYSDLAVVDVKYPVREKHCHFLVTDLSLS